MGLALSVLQLAGKGPNFREADALRLEYKRELFEFLKETDPRPVKYLWDYVSWRPTRDYVIRQHRSPVCMNCEAPDSYHLHKGLWLEHPGLDGEEERNALKAHRPNHKSRASGNLSYEKIWRVLKQTDVWLDDYAVLCEPCQYLSRRGQINLMYA